MQEQLIYEEGRIRITTNVFNNGRTNFVLATVKGMRDLHKAKAFWTLPLGLILLGLAGWREFFTYSREIMGAAGALFALWYFTSKECWSILLITPQGEVEAFRTKNEAQHKNIMQCLKRAIAMHQGQ